MRMAGKIPQEFIDDLLTRVDIVDVIDARVPLKKAGQNFVARCPFHDEKSPSFTVSPSKQFYHCFGCGAHGTAIGFLMEYERMDFVEALKELASSAGVELPTTSRDTPSQGSDQTGRLYELLEKAARFYRQQLGKHPKAQEAVDYLKGRGLSGEIAADFGIGYAPPGWDNLLKAFGGAGRQQELEAAGLVIPREGSGCYDRFRERVMFPIRDRRGRVIGFGGRVLGEGTPKYLNSPETAVFHKGRELYGLYEARQASRDLPRLLVVEGYMDVVALAQYGIRYAVATLGTAVTPEHLEQLFRVTHEVVFCFDGDRAGREAAWRGLEHAMPLMGGTREVRFMFMPEGEDPDTWVRKVGREEFESQLARAQPLSEFFFDTMREKTDLSRLDGQARLVELSRPLLSKLSPGAFQSKMIAGLAEFARMDRAEVQRVMGSPGAPVRALPQRRRPGAERHSPSQVRHAIALLLQRPALAGIAGEPSRLAGLALPGVKLLIEVLELLQNQPHLTVGALLEHWRGTPEGQHLVTLARRPALLDEEQDDLEKEFLGALEKLEQQRIVQRRNELSRKPFRELTPTEKLELQQLLKA